MRRISAVPCSSPRPLILVWRIRCSQCAASPCHDIILGVYLFHSDELVSSISATSHTHKYLFIDWSANKSLLKYAKYLSNAVDLRKGSSDAAANKEILKNNDKIAFRYSSYMNCAVLSPGLHQCFVMLCVGCKDTDALGVFKSILID